MEATSGSEEFEPGLPAVPLTGDEEEVDGGASEETGKPKPQSSQDEKGSELSEVELGGDEDEEGGAEDEVGLTEAKSVGSIWVSSSKGAEEEETTEDNA